MLCLKAISDQRWQIELQFSILRFFELSDLVNNHLLWYWPTIHNSISKICPKFQVISFHFFKVDELLDEHWAKIASVQSETISTPIYVESQAEISEINNSAPKKAVLNSSSNMTIHMQFFSDSWYESMVEWSRLVFDSLETCVWFLHCTETCCSAAGILHGTEPVSALTWAPFILLCSL